MLTQFVYPNFHVISLYHDDTALKVSFRPEISGMYGLSVAVQGTPLEGSPFRIRVRNDETIATNSKLYGPNLTRGVAGQLNTFYVQGANGYSFNQLRNAAASSPRAAGYGINTTIPDTPDSPATAVDGKGHARSVGGDNFLISIVDVARGGSVQSTLADQHNGTYEVTWSTDKDGEFHVTAKLDDMLVSGCPVNCTGGS